MVVVLASVNQILQQVLKRVNPSEAERKKVQKLAKKLTENVEKAIKEQDVDADVRIEGSVAKDTWLRDCPEIDVFMQVPTSVPRADFATVLLDVAKKATKDYTQIERFAEHPYVEAVADDVWLNVVPCYKVKRGKWLSATDRTPFHTDYLKPLLDGKLCQEVRLLKRFMKGVGVYGAEIKVGGFSGYLCELLILNYGSFMKALEAAADWKEKTVIDQKNHYKESISACQTFVEPLVMVDPVDKSRNVAAAVRKDKLDNFVAAAREFLKTPDITFFYPQETTPIKEVELSNQISSRKSTMVFIKFEGTSPVPDILWGQLYKSQKAVRQTIKRHDFKVINEAIWSNEKNLNVLLFEVQNRFLPDMKLHQGPPIQNRFDCEQFLKKHLGSESTVSGPRVEKGRWVADVKRKYTDVVELLKESLCDGGKGVGVADIVSKAVAETLEIIVNEQISNFYSEQFEFAKFLTDYLVGKPNWLRN
jgi:tRNA nucleotidyltransferase (CCA-adding enzyme)